MAFGKKRELSLPIPDYRYDSISERARFMENLKMIKNEVAAKDDVADPELPELPELPETEKGMPELPELPSEEPEEQEIAIPKAQPKQRIVTSETPRPLFIKVDKFKEMLASIETIDKKMREMSVIIQKLKDIRAREEETMAQWESEIQELKARLDVIEKTLSQVEK